VPQRDARQRINLVEPDSRVMRDAHGHYLQVTTSSGGEAGEERTPAGHGHPRDHEGNDRRTLAENLASVPAPFRQELQYVLADKGYDHADLIAAVEEKYQVTVLCPPQNEAPVPNPEKPRRLQLVEERRRARAQAMRERLSDPAHVQLYRRRSASIEPVFGVFKTSSVPPLPALWHVKAGIEITLLAIAYNLRQLARSPLKTTPQNA